MEKKIPQLDLLCIGVLFYDIVFAGLPKNGLALGKEIWTDQVNFGPGGIANIAIAASKLGIRTGLRTTVGDDIISKYLMATINDYHINTDTCVVEENIHLPVTVSLSYGGDRALVTADKYCWRQRPQSPTPSQISDMIYIDGLSIENLTSDVKATLKVIIGCGSDEIQKLGNRLSHYLKGCYALICNKAEAFGITNKENIPEALDVLLDYVEVAVITQGSSGMTAKSRKTSIIAQPPAPVKVIDPTGAGDSTIAAFIYGEKKCWDLAKTLAFCTIVSGLSVTSKGGADSVPTIKQVHDWITQNPNFTPYRFNVDTNRRNK